MAFLFFSFFLLSKEQRETGWNLFNKENGAMTLHILTLPRHINSNVLLLDIYITSE